VSPDILPQGSIYIEECEVDGQKYTDFDSFGLTVKLPAGGQRKSVKVKISPASWMKKPGK
jgi:hypothetical protein